MCHSNGLGQSSDVVSVTEQEQIHGGLVVFQVVDDPSTELGLGTSKTEPSIARTDGQTEKFWQDKASQQ